MKLRRKQDKRAKERKELNKFAKAYHAAMRGK